MAGFTRQVSGVSVPSAPRLQSNTGSTAGDLAAAASFGVGLFDRSQAIQKQAQVEQEVEAKAQAQQQAAINLDNASEAVLAFSGSQNLTGIAGERATESFMIGEAKRFGLSVSAVRKQVAASRNGTVVARIDRLATEEQRVQEAEAIAEKAKAEDLESLREEFAENSAFLMDGADDILNMSAAELQESNTLALVNKAKLNKIKLDAEASKLATSNAEEKRKIDVRSVSSIISNATAVSTAKVFDKLKLTEDLGTPEGIKNATDALRLIESEFPQIFRDAGAKQGLLFSEREVEEATGRLSAQITQLKSTFSRSDIATEGANIIKETGQGWLLNPAMTPAQSQAQKFGILSSVIKMPASLSTVEDLMKSIVMDSTGSRVTDVINGANAIIDQNGGSDSQKADAKKYMVEKMTSTLSPMVKDVPEDLQVHNAEMVMNNFTGSKKNIQEMVTSGMYINTVKGLAGERGAEVIPDEDKAEVLQTVMAVSDEVVRSSISAFIANLTTLQVPTPNTTALIGFSGIDVKVKSEDFYDVDENTLRITPNRSAASMALPRTANLPQLNNLLQWNLKAMENLGASDTDIKNFKKGVINALVIVDNKEEIKVKEKKDN